MQKRKRCPYCGSRRLWLRGKQRGVTRFSCKRCKRWFSERYVRGHNGRGLVRKIVNTYFDTRGSFRRTSDSINHRLGHMRIFVIVNRLGEGCKSPVQVARELHPRWSGMLGLDSKVVKVHGEERYLLMAVDIGTQDAVDSWLVRQENLVTLELFLKEVRDEIGYAPLELVIDLDPAWKEAVKSIFPDTPVQLCAVHFERIVDRTIPRFKRTPIQIELKRMVRDVLYAESEGEARAAFDQLIAKKGLFFRDRKSRYIMWSLQENLDLLLTHFGIGNSFRTNNITESVNDKIEMKLKMIRGYKKVDTARNSLKLILMHYRFKRFSSCRIKEHNGKSPLNLAGVDTSKLDWISYSQNDPSILNVL